MEEEEEQEEEPIEVEVAVEPEHQQPEPPDHDPSSDLLLSVLGLHSFASMFVDNPIKFNQLQLDS